MNWFKSSYCADASCVEVAKIGLDAVGLRDSKRPEEPFLCFDKAHWSDFLKGVKAGNFDGR
jgi:hypothetical protein